MTRLNQMTFSPKISLPPTLPQIQTASPPSESKSSIPDHRSYPSLSTSLGGFNIKGIYKDRKRQLNGNDAGT